MTSPSKELVVLLNTLKLLAAPADEQAAYIKTSGFGESIDELALMLNDALWTLPVLIQQGLLTEVHANSIRNLDQELDTMSGPQQSVLWNITALTTSDRWQEIRQQAHRIIQSLQ